MLLRASAGSSCHDDLDTLRRRADDASDKASDVDTASDLLASQRQELEDWRAFPQTFLDTLPLAKDKWLMA